MTAKLLKFADRLDDASVPWIEDDLQAYIVKNLRQMERIGWDFAADMNGVAKSSKREAGKAKILGLTEGEPDLRFYKLPGILKMIELKKKPGGSLTKSQKARFPLLESLGFEVAVIYGTCPVDAWEQVKLKLIEWSFIQCN